jgi:glycosyltransferase involved in cell wall biosynthesis
MTFIINKLDNLENGISLVSVVRNVEETYEMCLSQAAKICDEILIVNQSSTDQTDIICKELLEKLKKEGKNVYYEIKEKTGLGESHRQYLIDKAKYRWILLLDGDEYWSDVALQYIKNEFIFQSDHDELRIQRVTMVPGLKPQNEFNIAPRFWKKQGSFCPIELNAQVQGIRNPLVKNQLIIFHLIQDKLTLLKKYDLYDQYNEIDYQKEIVSKEKYLRDKKIIEAARKRILNQNTEKSKK